MSYVTIPRFILKALTECLDAGVVPSVRSGQGGNSHSVWLISFTVNHDGKLHEFTVRVTSSYSQQFIDFVCFCGPGFDGLITLRSMADCVVRARFNLDSGCS